MKGFLHNFVWRVVLGLALALAVARAASRNQSFSEPTIAFQYNSHLEDWDPDDDSGVPTLQGYIHINATAPNGDRLV